MIIDFDTEERMVCNDIVTNEDLNEYLDEQQKEWESEYEHD